MLRNRLITVLTLNDGVLFRTKQFQPDYRYTMNFVDAWSIDEICVLDVTRPGEGDRAAFFEVVSELASRCFVPLSCGGGVRTIEDVHALLRVGADKVVFNTGAMATPKLISRGGLMRGLGRGRLDRRLAARGRALRGLHPLWHAARGPRTGRVGGAAFKARRRRDPRHRDPKGRIP